MVTGIGVTTSPRLNHGKMLELLRFLSGQLGRITACARSIYSAKRRNESGLLGLPSDGLSLTTGYGRANHGLYNGAARDTLQLL